MQHELNNFKNKNKLSLKRNILDKFALDPILFKLCKYFDGEYRHSVIVVNDSEMKCMMMPCLHCHELK